MPSRSVTKMENVPEVLHRCGLFLSTPRSSCSKTEQSFNVTLTNSSTTKFPTDGKQFDASYLCETDISNRHYNISQIKNFSTYNKPLHLMNNTNNKIRSYNVYVPFIYGNQKLPTTKPPVAVFAAINRNSSNAV